MGFFDAFLRGAAGPGLIELSRSNERRDELAQQRADREAAKEEERKWRAEQAALDRSMREDLAGRRGGSRRSGAGGGGGDPGDDERTGVLAIAGKYGVSEPEARRLYEAHKSGANPYTRETQTPEQIDDGDRKRTVTVGGTAPDIERWRELNRTIAKALTNSGGNPAQNADARKTQVVIDSAEAYGRGDTQGALPGLFAQGKTAMTNEGSNVFTGLPTPGSRDEAQRAADQALARQRDAAAGKDRNETAANPKELTQANTLLGTANARLTAAEAAAIKLLPKTATVGKEPAEIAAMVAGDPGVVAARKRVQEAERRLDEAAASVDAKKGGGKAGAPALPANAPKGSRIGKQTPRGWEVLDSSGKVIGLLRD